MGLLLGTRRAAIAVPTYIDKMLGYDPVAYWPLNESAGTVANCLINPAQNGTYVSIIPGTGIGPDGSPCPWFDGALDYVQLLTAAGQAALNTATTEGSAVIWFRVVNVGAWTDGAFRSQHAFIDDADNRYQLYKSNANNTLYGLHYAGGTAETHTEAGQTSVDWMHTVITWSETADEVKYYLDANLLATDTIIGNWAGDGTWTTILIGASSGAPGTPWHGWLAHLSIFDRALSQIEIDDLIIV